LDMYGNGANYLAVAKKELKSDEHKSYIRKKIGLKKVNIENYAIDIPDRNIPYARLTGELTVSRQIRDLGDLLAITLPPEKTYELNDPEERTLPVRINVPVNRIDSIVYQLPFLTGYTVELPESYRFENQFGNIAVDFRTTGDNIVMTRHMQLNTGDYPKEQYAQLYELLNEVKNYHRKTKIVLNRKS
ncbi:MAG: DUF3858 domain-containing protein, partial [Cyclobacteriaceae bacterium]